MTSGSRARVLAAVFAVAAFSRAAPALAEPAASAATTSAAKEWGETLQLFQNQIDAVNRAARGLTTFSTTNKLTAKGKGAVKTVTAKLDASRKELQTTIDAATLMSNRTATTADDAVRFRQANSQALSDAAELVDRERVAEQDPSLVDRSEEQAAARRAAAERARAEQEAAREAAEARQREERDRRQAETERQKREAEDRARAAADARTKAEADRRAAAEAAAAAVAVKAAQAESKARAEADERVASLERQARELVERAREITLLLAAFAARPNVTVDGRGSAVQKQRSAETTLRAGQQLELRSATLRSQTPAQGAANAPALQGELDRLRRELTALGDATRALVGSQATYVDGVVPSLAAAPAPSAVPPGAAAPSAAPSEPPPKYRTEDLIPMCEISFEPASDARGTTLSLDGGPFRPLPSRARIPSGRHTLTTKRDKAVQERRELLLCGHVSSVVVEGPR